MEEEIEKEERKEKSNKKDSKNIVIVILVIIIIVLAAVLCVFLGKDKLIPKKENNTNVEEKEQVVTDAEKEQIKNKIYRLVGINNIPQNAVLFHGEVLKRQLKDGEKQFLILLTAKYDDITDDSWKEIPKVKADIENELAHVNLSNTSEQDYIKREYHFKKLEDVKKDYKNMFGEEINNPIEDIGRCPTVYYFQEKEIYYKYPVRCGGIAVSDVISYVTDYQKKNDEITANVYIGFISPKSDDISSNDIGVFSDFEITEETQSDYIMVSVFKGINLIETNEKNESGQYIINDNNKELFSKYQLTFKLLENDEYYFVKAEQVK